MTVPSDRTKPKAAPRSRKTAVTGKNPSRIERTTEFSEQVLDHVSTGQRNAIEAVRKFMKSADQAVPSLGRAPTRRHTVIDSALDMSERLVKVELDFVRNVVHSAGEALSGANGRN
jgi:hypothetical protein